MISRATLLKGVAVVLFMPASALVRARRAFAEPRPETFGRQSPYEVCFHLEMRSQATGVSRTGIVFVPATAETLRDDPAFFAEKFADTLRVWNQPYTPRYCAETRSLVPKFNGRSIPARCPQPRITSVSCRIFTVLGGCAEDQTVDPDLIDTRKVQIERHPLVLEAIKNVEQEPTPYRGTRFTPKNGVRVAVS